MKYFGISLTKEVKNTYAKNYKTLIKETEVIQRNRKISYALGWKELIL